MDWIHHDAQFMQIMADKGLLTRDESGAPIYSAAMVRGATYKSAFVSKLLIGLSRFGDESGGANACGTSTTNDLELQQIRAALG